MSVTSVFSAANPYSQSTLSTQASAFKQRQQDLQALGQALSSGNLSAAQGAFASLMKELHGLRQPQIQPTGQSTLNSLNSVQSALQALGQALSSGNLSAAQSAFATLQQDMQNAAQAHHHHHHHLAGTVQTNTSTTASGSGTTPPSNINVTA